MARLTPFRYRFEDDSRIDETGDHHSYEKDREQTPKNI